ncbi:hypothetical protein [Sphingomonas sp.]|uniref:hypothetical protein n=1 Tax=Sphingomonas sp. TaxID=28214 RepID=UPI003CC6CA99
MSKLHGDQQELTDRDAAIIKGMVGRGDKNETIAAFFGVNQRAVSHVRSGQTFANVVPARPEQLPPPGPYGVDPIYIKFYQTVTRVNWLWDQRKLPQAKELLEKALRNPVFVSNLDEGDEMLCEITRDQFGVSQL